MSEKLKNEEQKFFEKKQYIEKYMDKSNAKNENEKQLEKINELRDELKGLNKNLIDKNIEVNKIIIIASNQELIKEIIIKVQY